MNNDLLSRVFKINGGYCHILRDQIALLKSDTLPEDGILPTGSSPTPRIYYVLVFFGLALIGFGIYGYFKDFIFESCFIAACGIALFLYSYRRTILSRGSVVERDSIEEVRFRHGVPGQTASRFIVFFRDNNNKLQEMRIVLTNRPDYGDEKAKEAIAIMNRHFDIKSH